MPSRDEQILELQSAGPGGARTIAFGGGKGGVGKSFLVANLALAIAREGHRVIAVDTDLEGANLHTMLGVPRPSTSLADFVARRERDVAKLAVDTPYRNLQLIAATDANLGDAQPRPALRGKLLRALPRLPADFVLVDLGAGTHAATVDYFLVGDDGVLVLAPEPVSVENAYAFLRAVFYRRLRLAMSVPEVCKVVNLAMDQRNERGIRTPLDLLREVQSIDPDEGRRFVESMRRFRPGIVVNGVRSTDDIHLGFSVRSVCRKHFGIQAEYLGYVNQDPAVRQAVRMRRPVVESNPRSDAAVYLKRIARKLLGRPSARRAPRPLAGARA